MKCNSEVNCTSLRWRHHRCWHLPWLSTYSPQPSSRRSKNEFCTKGSLELHHPISHLLKVCCLTQSIHTTLAQLLSGHCRLLNSYKARITSGISDVCPECGMVPPHSVEHLFNRQSHPTQLTVGQPGCSRRVQTSSTWTTDDRRRAAGLSQQQQQRGHLELSW